MLDTKSVEKYAGWNKIFINGEWKEGSSAKRCEVTNPYNSSIIATLNYASKKDIAEAYEKAQTAQRSWSDTSPYERVTLLENVASLLEAKKDELVELLVSESGSSKLKASVEVDCSIADVKESAKYPLQMEGKVRASSVPGKENHIYRDPVGVIGAITPWNWPLYLTVRVIAPAIATGNSVVLKPDAQTPISGGLMIAKIFEEAGLPDGVLNVVVADLEEIEDYFVEHPIPEVISFTGSTNAGRHVGAVAVKNLKKPALELGGNNAFIVLDDANIDQAVSAAAFGKYMHSGQICIAINRIIVDRKVYEPFVEKFKEATARIKAGDPSNDDTVIGPLINRNQVDRALELIEESIREGANLVKRGEVSGNVMEPFILSDVTNDMAVAKNEIFSPVAVIIPVDSEEEAIEVANGTPFGLSGAVFSASLERGLTIARKIKTGMIHVNDQTINVEPNVPFGGEKYSGLGRYCGEWAIEEFTTVKWVSVQKKFRQYPFS
ncbi:aldehyde dehydrogenase family protein [Vreelandella maris]|uniref:Aldehyde dehydrogenase family protein n=1 Tax=Vreelandella maris TaxID=2729617 RepID=A0A7Y6RGB0_9GAMM|nr:aldehyde dehydrogenase family protein [Halomonas maris]NVF16519.1 aldehyde dehydrogenase family protein [Halomonas maris]|tara:strand:+ start:508 stop:1986 length:1479 start_codon:yes stop_codon:yes gene_type:complete